MKKRICIQDLKNFVIETLIKTGVRPEHAQTTADVLVTTDLFGIYTHGTKNLYGYIEKIKAGGLDPSASPEVEKEGPSFAVVNANACLGMVSSTTAMDIAIRKAKQTCISYVGVRNSCHFGAAGYYSNMAAKEGMIGIAMSNTDPNMSIPGSSGVAIGNNPISYAFPTSDNRSVFLDIALSSVASLKVIKEKNLGNEVPLDWIVDKEGKPTSDPSGFPYTSFLQPMGRHKGYGLAVLVDVLAAILTGSGLLRDVKSWNLDYPSFNNVGHAFIVIDIRQILDFNLFEDRINRMICELKSTAREGEGGKIYLPGEIEWARREECEKSGSVALDEDVVDQLEKVSTATSIPLRWIDP